MGQTNSTVVLLLLILPSEMNLKFLFVFGLLIASATAQGFFRRLANRARDAIEDTVDKVKDAVDDVKDFFDGDDEPVELTPAVLKEPEVRPLPPKPIRKPLPITDPKPLPKPEVRPLPPKPIREPLPRTDPKPLPKPGVRPLPPKPIRKPLPRTDPKPLPKPAVRPLPPKPIRKPLPKPEEKVIIEEPELIIEPKPELIIEPKPEASPCQIFHRMARHPRRSFMVHAFASSSTNNQQQQQQQVIKLPVTATQKELIAVKPQQNCFIAQQVAKVPRYHFTTSSAAAAASAFANHQWMTAGNDKKPTYFTHTETSTSQNIGKAFDHHYNVKASASASSSSSKRSSVRVC